MDAFCFAAASCQYPGGLLDKQPAYDSYARLGKWIDESRSDPASAPQLLLLLGDQVYVDATAGLFDPALLSTRYQRPYEVLYDQPSVSKVMNSLDGVYCMLDDHEIEDNWEPVQASGGNDADRKKTAVHSYKHWQRSHGPKFEQPCGDSLDPLWFKIDRGIVRFFVADTRTERKPRNAANVSEARIMSDTQFDALCKWLKECDRSTPKIVACPSIVLPRRRSATGHPANALRSDAWDGYPSSLYALLAFIAENQIPNVVFVSGDEHISSFARITLAGSRALQKVIVHSIHTSPLYSPYPFINSVQEDLIGDECFTFAYPSNQGTQYHCQVTTRFPDCGDSFSIISVARDSSSSWTLSVDFCGKKNEKTYKSRLTE